MMTAFLEQPRQQEVESNERLQSTHQVITLSAMGEAETPAGGSVCMRYNVYQQDRTRNTTHRDQEVAQ